MLYWVDETKLSTLSVTIRPFSKFMLATFAWNLKSFNDWGLLLTESVWYNAQNTLPIVENFKVISILYFKGTKSIEMISGRGKLCLTKYKLNDGDEDGSEVGREDGCFDGFILGWKLGWLDGVEVGCRLGHDDGWEDGCNGL